MECEWPLPFSVIDVLLEWNWCQWCLCVPVPGPGGGGNSRMDLCAHLHQSRGKAKLHLHVKITLGWNTLVCFLITTLTVNKSRFLASIQNQKIGILPKRRSEEPSYLFLLFVLHKWSKCDQVSAVKLCLLLFWTTPPHPPPTHQPPSLHPPEDG